MPQTRTTDAGEAAALQAAGARLLAVTDGNPAERLYASAGFRRRRTLFVLETG